MTKHEAVKRAVRIWLAEHGKTQAWLAKRLREDETFLSRVLGGYREATPEMNERMVRLTGISFVMSTPDNEAEVVQS